MSLPTRNIELAAELASRHRQRCLAPDLELSDASVVLDLRERTGRALDGAGSSSRWLEKKS
jgi:hypothetical protein